MKRIYLLALLCLLGYQGFSTTYFSDCFPGGRVDSLKNWNSLLTGGGIAPTTFLNPGDSFVINIAMSDSVGWTVAGSVHVTASWKHVVSSSDTIRIGRNLNFSGTAPFDYTCNGAGNVELYVGGDLTFSGTSHIGTTGSCSPPNYIHLHFNGTPLYPAAQKITWTSTAASDHTSMSVESGSRTMLNSANIKIPANSDTGFVVQGGGALICGTNVLDGQSQNQFNLYDNATIYTAHTGGLNGSITNTLTQFFDEGAHYVFNGTAPQVTGAYMPGTLVAPGTDTIDNATGVTLSAALSCNSGTSTNLELGTFNISPFALAVNTGSAVNVDGGTFDTNPIYAGLINVTLENLGANVTPWNTSFELKPTSPATSIGKITVNKPGDLVILGSSATANDSVIIAAGSLSAHTGPSYDITAKWAWINNSSATAFVAFAGNVFLTGISGTQHIGGSFPTTFNNLLLNNVAGAVIDTDENVGDTLTLTAGNLSIGTHKLSLAASAVAVQPGTFDNTHMIIADSTGVVVKSCSADGSYLFPIGDSGPNYSPITIYFTGISYGPGSELDVNLRPRKEPNNMDITDYTNRYWTVHSTFSGTDSVVATYVPADVTGSPTDISMGQFVGLGLAWNKYYPAVGSTISSANIVLTGGGVSDFTGISTLNPSVSITADTLICGGAVDSIKVLTVFRDAPFTYTWAPSGGLSATTGMAVAATPTVTTIYTLTVTDGNGFVTTATSTVSVNPTPSLTGVGNSGPVCEGDTLFLTTTGAVNVMGYSWTGPGTIAHPTFANTFVAGATPSGSGDYVVTVDNGIGIGCSMTYTTTAVVNPMAGSISVTPGGAGFHTFCDSTLINAFSIGGDDIFYHGITAGSVLTDSLLSAIGSPISIYKTGTYYFRPRTSFGCWGFDDSVKIRINYAPTPVTVTGVSPNCDSTRLIASNGDSGIIYYQGLISGGTSKALADTNVLITALGTNTYYFRAVSDSGCWSIEGSESVTLSRSADAVVATGGGTFCGQTVVHGTYSGVVTATVHAQAGPGGTDATTADSLVVSSSGTYYFRAISDSGCWGQEDSVTVSINPLPAFVTVTGVTPSCDSTLITASNGGDGTIYYHGSNALDTSTAIPSTSEEIYSSGTYYFRARSAAGCWSPETDPTDSITVEIDMHAQTVTVTGGGGPFCGSTVITGSTTDGSTVYFQGNTSGGTSTGLGGSPQTVSVSGTYYFRAQSTAGCWGQEDSVTVLINPLPSMFNLTGGGQFCAGDTGKHVGLDGSQTGIKYVLYNGPDPVGDSLMGNGSPLDFGLFTTAGTYTILAVDTQTLCGTPMNGGSTIIVNQLPGVYFLTPAIDSYCVGGSGIELKLSQSDPDVNYYVYNGPTLITIVPGSGAFDFSLGFMTAVGTYTVVAINPTTSCKSTMLDSAVVKTNPLPNVYAVGGGGERCVGGPQFHITLSGSDSSLSYQLYSGVTAVGFPVIADGTPIDFGLDSVAGTFTVMATNLVTGCTNMMADSAVVTVNPLPVVGTITGGGVYCSGGVGVPMSLDVSESGVNYNLYHGDTVLETVAGDGSPILDLGLQTLGGLYSVIAVNATTGCSDSMIGMVAVNINGLPTPYSIFGGGAFCIGGVGYDVGISGSQIGKSYQLYNGVTAVGSPLYGTGLVLLFGYQTAAGNYTVVATDTSTGCTNNMIGSTTIVVYSLPIVYHVTGGGHYCSGGTGVHVGISGSNIGIAYRLYLGADTVGGYVDGTGSALDFGLFTTAGTYTMKAVNLVTGCTVDMDSFAVVSIDPLPAAFSVTGGGSYCVAGSGVLVGLSGSAHSVFYQLYQGTVSIGGPLAGTDTALNFGLQTGAGIYTVVATDSTTGCTSTMTGSKTISINPLPPVHLLIGGGSIVYCLGDTGIHIGLTASDIGIAYQLFNGVTPVGDSVLGTGFPIDFGLQTVGGTYTVVAKDIATGCTSTMSGTSVISVASPVIPVVNIIPHPGLHIGVGSLDTLVAVVTAGAGTYATYQWYVNGNLVPGATSDTFSFLVYFNTDSITCEVTSHGPCGGHTTIKSVFITLTDVGVRQVTFTGSDIRLIPNPNKGAFALKGTLGTTEDQDVFVEVTNMLGQVVYKEQFTAHNGNMDEHIQLSGALANGMYLLNLRSGSQNNIFHFVIEQ